MEATASTRSASTWKVSSQYSADEITAVLDDYPDLEVAVYAAPTHTVIGGPEPQVDAIVARAEAEALIMAARVHAGWIEAPAESEEQADGEAEGEDAEGEAEPAEQQA